MTLKLDSYYKAAMSKEELEQVVRDLNFDISVLAEEPALKSINEMNIPELEKMFKVATK